MANQVTLEMAAGSSSPPSMNENNESSSTSSPCDSDHASGNLPTDVLSNDATGIPMNPQQPIGSIDSDSNGESSYSNTVDVSSDTTGSVTDYGLAGSDGGSTGGSVQPQRFSVDREMGDKSTTATSTTATNTNATITATTTTTTRKTDAGVPADSATYRTKCKFLFLPRILEFSF